MTVRWGIAGIGRHADTYMVPAIAAVEGAQLVAVMSRDAGRGEDFARRHGAGRWYTRYEDLASDPDVDAILVTTPNAFHAEQVAIAAEHGKHVLCDKPLALSRSEAVAAVEACRRAGVRLGIDFQMRHTAWASRVRTLLAEGAVGQVVAVEAEHASGRIGVQGWRTDPAMAGLGAVNNIGVHTYDLLRHLLGAEVVEVMAMFDRPPGDGVELLAMVLLRFEGGAVAHVNANQAVVHPRNDLAIYGTQGRILALGLNRHDQEGELRVVSGGVERASAESTRDAYRRCIADFCHAVVEGREPLADGLDGLRSVELTEAIARSAREGELVGVVRSDLRPA